MEYKRKFKERLFECSSCDHHEIFQVHDSDKSRICRRCGNTMNPTLIMTIDDYNNWAKENGFPIIVKDKKCNHKWVDMEDGSLDKFCVRCRLKAKQAILPPLIPNDARVANPSLLRDKILEEFKVPKELIEEKQLEVNSQYVAFMGVMRLNAPR